LGLTAEQRADHNTPCNFLSQNFTFAHAHPSGLRHKLPLRLTSNLDRMKTFAIASLLCLSTVGASAQEVGQVTSRSPIYQQVAMPRQTCSPSVAVVPAQNSGGGALIGAIAGGLIGSQFGGRDSRGIATMAGVIGGAVIGDRAETQNNTPITSTTCTTQTVYENRLVGYNVVYEYAGKQYQVQLPQDPGPTISLQVTPVGSPREENHFNTQTISSGTTRAPAPVTVIQESRVVYVPSPTYRNHPPVYSHIDRRGVWSSHHRHSHWR
jgi:uncharacterized protein YcfJ